MDHRVILYVGVGTAIFASMAGAFTAIFVPLLARQLRKQRNA